jgi:hypothetical protein
MCSALLHRNTPERMRVAYVYMSMSDNGSADRVADAGEAPRLVSQSTLDALADAQTLIVNARPKHGSALWAAQDLGSRAVVAYVGGAYDRAEDYTFAAFDAALEAVPGLISRP